MNDLTALLRCPLCRGKLQSGKKIRCTSCQQHYPKYDGIPYLLPPALQKEYHDLKKLYEQKDVAARFGIDAKYTGSVKYRNILRKKVIDRACKKTPTGGIIADIGCGNGLLLQGLRMKRKDVHAIALDFSLAMVIEARKRLGTEKIMYVVGSVNALPLVSRAIDTTVCVDVLKNFSRKSMMKESVNELLRVTKGSSFIEFVIATPFDRLITWTYRFLQMLSVKEKVQQTPLAGISVNKVRKGYLKNLFAGARWKLCRVHPLLNWAFIEVRK